ncbi:MAG: VCBS repeat-containing protein [Planctomycetes bacterium]|nr:VCBS repeat-containing protein [Planctomycetota bacterium]
MKTYLLPSLLALAAPAWSQSEIVLTIERPDPLMSGWGHALVPLGDVDGDGTRDFAVSTHEHATLFGGSVHSGKTGAHLYTLTVPFEPCFWGGEIIELADETGDGVGELMLVGEHSFASGSPDGRLQVYSGADGALLRSLTTPAGVLLMGHEQGANQTFGDIDGDGVDDVLCQGYSGATGRGKVMLSGATAQPIWWATPSSGTLASNEVARLDDMDGDGRDDFAVLVLDGVSRSLEVHSSADGALLRALAPTGLEQVTQNGEPVVSVADLDGDGLRDVAVGGVFLGLVAIYSSTDGALLREWRCAVDGSPCMGGAIVEPGDLNGDGHPDLVVLEGAVQDTDTQAFALDPVTGEVLRTIDLRGTSAGYGSADGITAVGPGAPLDFPGFLAFEALAMEVTLHQLAPSLGSRGCAAAPHSGGDVARVDVVGSASLAADALRLELANGVPNQPGVFVHGTAQVAVPFGAGTLCAGGRLGRFHTQQLDAAGHMSLDVPAAVLALEGPGARTFQGLFRDPAAGTFNTSDAVTVDLAP